MTVVGPGYHPEGVQRTRKAQGGTTMKNELLKQVMAKVNAEAAKTKTPPALQTAMGQVQAAVKTILEELDQSEVGKRSRLSALAVDRLLGLLEKDAEAGPAHAKVTAEQLVAIVRVTAL